MSNSDDLDILKWSKHTLTIGIGIRIEIGIRIMTGIGC